MGLDERKSINFFKEFTHPGQGDDYDDKYTAAPIRDEDKDAQIALACLFFCQVLYTALIMIAVGLFTFPTLMSLFALFWIHQTYSRVVKCAAQFLSIIMFASLFLNLSYMQGIYLIFKLMHALYHIFALYICSIASAKL